MNPVISTGRVTVDIGVNANLDLVGKFLADHTIGHAYKWAGIALLTSPTGFLLVARSDHTTETHTHTHNRFTALLEFLRDHLGEQVPEW